MRCGAPVSLALVCPMQAGIALDVGRPGGSRTRPMRRSCAHLYPLQPLIAAHNSRGAAAGFPRASPGRPRMSAATARHSVGVHVRKGSAMLIEQRQWTDYFDELSRQAERYETAIEVMSGELGYQVEVRRAPLLELAFDAREGVSVSVGRDAGHEE